MQKIVFFFFSALLFVSCSDKVEPDFKPQIMVAYPNPAQSQALIYIYNDTGQTGVIRVFDPSGTIILKESVPDGPQNYPVDLSDSSNGKFHAVFTFGSDAIVKTFIKR